MLPQRERELSKPNRLHRRNLQPIWRKGNVCFLTLSTYIFQVDNIDKNTNVIELYSLIDVWANQETWYNSGIGTYARPSWKSLKHYKKVLWHKIDLAIAWWGERSILQTSSLTGSRLFRDFERTVLGAYRWLSDNYQPRDRIFLFGELWQIESFFPVR